MNCTVGPVSFFCEFPLLALEAWHEAAGLVHQWNYEKQFSKDTPQFILSLSRRTETKDDF